MPLHFGAGEDKPVRRPEDVQGYLHPDKKHHYRNGYSMAEAAKCWCAAQPLLPAKVAALVGAPDLPRAHFEYPTRVWGGGTAMADVMAFIPNGVIAVEAKVNEAFDDLLGDWIERDGKANPRSPDHRRKVVGQYAEGLGVKADDLLAIRYQLLQRTLGAARTAKAAGLPHAWMVVQDLSYGRGHGHARNRADYDAFVTLVGPMPSLEGMPVQLAWIDEADPAGA
jgi:hypothetical protein